MRRPECWGGMRALLVTIAALIWWTTRATYTCYVSPPLPGGTRYTFLYPTRLHLMAQSAREVSLQDAPRDRSFLSELPEIISRAPHRNSPLPDVNAIRVGVFPLREGSPFSKGERVEKSGPL